MWQRVGEHLKHDQNNLVWQRVGEHLKHDQNNLVWQRVGEHLKYDQNNFVWQRVGEHLKHDQNNFVYVRNTWFLSRYLRFYSSYNFPTRCWNCSDGVVFYLMFFILLYVSVKQFIQGNIV